MDLQENILELLRKSPDLLFNTAKTSCGKFNNDDFIKCLHDHEHYEEIIEHCLQCQKCKTRLIQAIKQEESLEKQADKLIDPQMFARLSRTAREVVSRYLNNQEDFDNYAWAAADKKSGNQGKALGIAVTTNGQYAGIIECTAWVSNRQDRNTKFVLLGRQKRTLADGSEIDGPLDYLEEKLERLFLTIECLQPFHLHQRKITVDLGSKVLAEADCLGLPIIMAILNAIFKRNNNDNAVYSAGLTLEGDLDPVGNILQKVEAARKLGISTFTMTLAQLCEHDYSSADFQVKGFKHLGDLLDDREMLIQYSSGADEQRITTPYKKPEPPTPTQPQDQCDFIGNILKTVTIEPGFLRQFIQFCETFCLSPHNDQNTSMLIIIGEQSDISKILPKANFFFIGNNKAFFHQASLLHEWIPLLDNCKYTLAITRDGSIDGFYQIDNISSDRPDLARLISGREHQFAVLSRLTDSLIFYFLPGFRQLHLFTKGKMIGKFMSGTWHEVDYSYFNSLLEQRCMATGINVESAELAARAAINMAENGNGGTFAFIPPDDDHTDFWKDNLDSKCALSCQSVPLDQLAISSLETLARQDGAVLIDHYGNLVSFGSFFTDELTSYPSFNLRHNHAREFSRKTGSLVLVASSYGTITLFERGEIIYQL